MTQAQDQIKSGILFEEDIVHILAQDIKLMHGYTALPSKVQHDIQSILQTMIADSEKHRELLQGIVDSY